MRAFFKAGRRPDYFLLALVFILTLSGLVILASASSELGKIRFNDSYYYLKHQVLYGLSIGLAGFIAAFFINYQIYKKLALWFLLGNILLLIMVFIPHVGVSSGGASRWLNIGGFLFQPAELLKLSFLLYLAAWISGKQTSRMKDFMSGALPFFIICGAVAVLLLLQPATSTVVILITSGLIMYFESGARITHLIGFGAVGAIGLLIVIWATPYRMKRIMTFIHPDKDTQGTSYQINQALITIGSGNIFGVGYGQSTSKVNYLPAPLDDSIFAIAAQELGFVGAASIVLFFGMLVWRLMYLAKGARDKFGHVILTGFASIIALQSLVHMGSISGILPLTGVPLPFVSYGGTALAVFLTMMGVAGNISRQH
jgi:cell division protein FtsW